MRTHTVRKHPEMHRQKWKGVPAAAVGLVTNVGDNLGALGEGLEKSLGEKKPNETCGRTQAHLNMSAVGRA